MFACQTLARIYLGGMFTSAVAIATATSADVEGLRIGVTLHPYYSWVQNPVTEPTEVIPILAAGSDPHVYQPVAEDIKRLATLTLKVILNSGHEGTFTLPLDAL